MTRRSLISWLAPTLLLVPTTSTAWRVTMWDRWSESLWLVQRYGTAESVQPQNDQKVKGKLSKALGKQGILTAAGVQGLMDPSTFAKLAGDKGQLDPTEVKKCLEADVPESRKEAQPQGRRSCRHADHLLRHDRRDAP